MECYELLTNAVPPFNLAHRGQLLRVAAAIFCEELNAVHRQRASLPSVEEHMVQAFEKLPVDELLNLSVADLGSRFGCSRRHLNRVFHQYFGLSVGALKMEIRLTKAILLLREPDAKVANVAEQCGFDHLGFFNVCFKRRFGTTPGRWRQSTPEEEKLHPGAAADKPACPLHSIGLCPWLAQSQTGIPAPPRGLLVQRPGPKRSFPGTPRDNDLVRQEAVVLR